ncbi:MAG TPA: hypothetical protein VGH28_10755 [Polyangiaceae bacterium]|jgi:hypothetical protein
MNDPIRLLASPEATDFERELLGAWGDEKPTAASRDKTLAALGLAGSAAAAAAGSMAPKALASGWALVAKWIGLGALVVGAAAVGAAHLAHHDEAPLARPIAMPTEHLVPAPQQTVATAETTVELPEAPPQHAHARVAAPVASSITQQVAALDRARAALDAGDPARAVRLVDAYESEYASGAFVQEAEVVRIESLVRAGKTADADRAGKHFLASYPRSPHDARVRSLLGYAREP